MERNGSYAQWRALLRAAIRAEYRRRKSCNTWRVEPVDIFEEERNTAAVVGHVYRRLPYFSKGRCGKFFRRDLTESNGTSEPLESDSWPARTPPTSRARGPHPNPGLSRNDGAGVHEWLVREEEEEEEEEGLGGGGGGRTWGRIGEGASDEGEVVQKARREGPSQGRAEVPRWKRRRKKIDKHPATSMRIATTPVSAYKARSGKRGFPSSQMAAHEARVAERLTRVLG
ncbi:hypothetical protein KM043_006679 [Ampulex compressa]|nr:hypothetical protein KM043_006679 [Ampulex compressa]